MQPCSTPRNLHRRRTRTSSGPRATLSTCALLYVDAVEARRAGPAHTARTCVTVVGGDEAARSMLPHCVARRDARASGTRLTVKFVRIPFHVIKPAKERFRTRRANSGPGPAAARSDGESRRLCRLRGAALVERETSLPVLCKFSRWKFSSPSPFPNGRSPKAFLFSAPGPPPRARRRLPPGAVRAGRTGPGGETSTRRMRRPRSLPRRVVRAAGAGGTQHPWPRPPAPFPPT